MAVGPSLIIIIITIIIIIIIIIIFQAVPAPAPVGPSLNQAAVGLAGLALAAKIAEDECDDVGVGSSLLHCIVIIIEIIIVILQITIVIMQIISAIIIAITDSALQI